MLNQQNSILNSASCMLDIGKGFLEDEHVATHNTDYIHTL